jgi:hypothetical protein
MNKGGQDGKRENEEKQKEIQRFRSEKIQAN